MQEEADIMDELHRLNGELKAFPSQAHWFCPRRYTEDPVDYDNPDEAEEDASPELKHKLIQDAKRRHEVAYKYSLVLGLAPDVSGRLLEDYTSRLNELLTACDKCIHNWHMGRKAHLKELSEQLDDETVAELSNRLNVIDFHRIDEGLKVATELLAGVQSSQRTQSFLMKKDIRSLLALYEALCCVDYHKSEENLATHFNYVFEEVQKRKVLRLSDILPAMARFLFNKDSIRLRFATVSWQKGTTELDKNSFEWVVHDTLSEAMAVVSQHAADPEDIERFWHGFLLMLEKMDESLITHSVRAMEVQPNIYFLALQHLACTSEVVIQLIVDAFCQLLKIAPKDFWSALGTISPATFAEQIFLSPGFGKILSDEGNFVSMDESPATAWITVFIGSLEPVHQYDACRSLLYHLLDRFQKEALPEQSKIGCCRAGLQALSATLQTFTKSEYIINPSTSLIVINDIMGLVNHHKETIMGCAGLPDDEDKNNMELKRLGMKVVKDALALDCKAISAEFFALDNGTAVQRGLRTHSQSIWQAVLEIFRPGNLELAKSILPATSVLTGMDELRPKDKKKPEQMRKDHVQFNKDFKQLTDDASRIFQRLSDFEDSDLQQLCQIPLMARPLFAALVSSDQSICEATVELIKAMTGQDTKQDAISSLLEQAFVPLLNSLTYAVARVTTARNFGPAPYMIKIGRDVLKALCGNTGVLRTRSGLSTAEQNAAMSWWTGQWRALDMVFSTTEHWGNRVNQTTVQMQDFCRDGMEYAEALFDQYSIVASALRDTTSQNDDRGSATSVSSKSSLKKVLNIVCQNVNGLTMLLRLRDSYLVSVITSLLGKLLRSLGEYGLEIDERALDYIKDACKRENERDFKRTNLSNQQKAELQRALDEHRGIEVIEISPQTTTIKKQATIDGWSKSADGKIHEPTLPGKSYGLPSLQTDKHRAALQQMKAQQAAKQAAKQAMSQQSSNLFREQRKQAEEERKRQNAEAAAKAKALRGPSSIVKGEGSGLKDIGGVAGKDHAPIRSEIMVGSSDDDSDDGDDDDVDESNALVKRRKETSKKVTEYEESKRRALKQARQGPVKKTKVQRSAKDLRARVEPNMDRLYLEILGWDVFHPGDTPPGNNECRKIDNKYTDLDLYKRTFGPLLISEVWRSLVTAKDENNFKAIEVKILNRLSVDKFMEISTNMPMNRDLKISERDIFLLSRSPDPLGNKQEPHCLARVDRTNRKKDLIEVTFRVSRDIDRAFSDCLAPNTKIHALKIADMTTTQREFAALSSLDYYDLCNEVLEATPSPLQKYPDEKISLMSSKYKLNKGQAQAILSANDNDGFTLIQGPPGSGKTKTIVAMVGALLTSSLQLRQTEQARARPQVQGQPAAAPPPKKKLLICAPSNAAVDELVLRLKEGVQPLDGPRQKINVIRIGRSDAINASVKDVMLDELVRMKLEGDNGAKNKLLNDKDKLHQEAAKIKERLNLVRPQMDEARAKGDKALELNLSREFDQLKRSQAHIGAKIEEDKESGNTVTRQNEINRRRFQQEIIDGAHVLCATLSGSGHDMFRNLNVEFETVIIDEAAQCIELSALIPLKYGCSKCILVGDPEQLPPTVLSRSAQSYGYEQSLFVRMQRNHPNDIHLLDTQYRMHPEISSFPSQQFYRSRLVDGPNMAALRDQPWHASSILGPYRFFDVEGIQTQGGHSFINIPEINAAMKLYERLKTDYRGVNFKGMIGVIASYKAQLIELKNRFSAKYGDAIFDEIEFNTTDAFQGREREIIIFSCVRAKATGGIGFLGDIRRMNVGLTRAKSSLWVLGDSRSLQQGEFWNKLIEDAKKRDRYTGGDVLALFSKPSSRDRKPVREALTLSNVQSNGYNPQSSSPAGVSDALTYPARPRIEDDDTEMIDAPSTDTSRKSSVSGQSSMSGMSGDVIKGNRPRDLKIKQGSRMSSLGIKKENRMSSLGIEQESRNPSPASGSATPSDVNSFGKRRRESLITDGDDLVKKTHPAKNDKVPDLEGALAAKNAQKATRASPAPRPAGPPGVAPPRKKAPVDPFIRKKPPIRR